jgi:hypothetical protein
MGRALSAVLASIMVLAPVAALASDGGQASIDPTTLKGPKCPRLPDDINLGGGLYMCARIDCSPPPGYTPPPGCNPQKNIVAVPNGDLALNSQGDIIQVGGPESGQTLIPESAGGTGYDGSGSGGP